ncbi:hypothetical protein [Croceibacterium aestuarii]|uniref:hypothetical protein n=1 Tax=Croceibacterium aestuarii TaxID=3064139 RepID=UPI00272DCA08|nr:hypothetical protein [Croceibacterium sp. D39]
MTPASPSPRRPYRRLRVPAFYPVPVRTRRDGWTIERQADFLGLLAETGSVIGACEAVGMSRKSAYRLRALPGAESFAAAWDAALGMPSRKVTAPPRDFLGCNPLVHLVMFRGRYRGAWRHAANGALLHHVRQPRGAGEERLPVARMVT